MSCCFKSILKDVYQKVQLNYALILILFVSVLLRILYIDAPLLDIHAFRQTQVAISVQYLLNHGLSFDNIYNYKTPVFGSPWMVPFEAPIFQVSAFFVHKVLSILFCNDNLDISLRITNIVYFYLSAYVLYLLVKYVTTKEIAFITILLYLFMPFAIFWSRTSMMEYCATFFSISYLYNFIIYSQRRTFKYVVFAVIFGILGYLAKSTSMVPSCIFIGLYYLIKVKPLRFKYIKHFKFVLSEILMVAIPLICGYLWVLHTDIIKSMSLATQSLTSEELKNWNFGTLAQKLDWTNWKTIQYYIKQQWGYTFILLVFFYIVNLIYDVLSKKRNLIDYQGLVLVISLSASLFTIFLFFNLYFIHNYYHIAVNYLECIVVAISLSFVIHKVKSLSSNVKLISVSKYIRYTSYLALIICLTSNIIKSEYTKYYTKHDLYVGPSSSANFVINVSNQIIKITPYNKSIICLGFDYDSSVPYYSNRKALMLPNWFNESLLNAILSNDLSDYSTFICNDKTSKRGQLVKNMLNTKVNLKEIKTLKSNVSYFVLEPK